MSESLLPKRFLFRFSVPCRYRQPIWTAEGSQLDASYQLPNIAELEDTPALLDFRMAWSETGLAFQTLVRGKRQPPWCRANRPEDSDGVRIWIDTRDVHNVHRAGRFCHQFLFLPAGGGNRLDEAIAQWWPINRAKEHPKAIAQGQVRLRSERLADGYLLDAFLAAEALTGFDPQEHPRLGFTYAVVDRELGELTFSAGSPMPYQEDPSLWATLELMR
ncbi:MAG: hypothetical protein GXY83_30210 [Rhodopirellula sp.]|nr:hypothetical protein [Rhodopirellula sp.]